MTELEFTGTYKTVTNYVKEQPPSSLEHHIDSKTKYEEAKFVLWSDCFTSNGDVRMIPINDVKACWWLTKGEKKVESQYHQECSGEHYAQQKQKKAEQDLDSIADGTQTEVQNHETYRQKDLQERLKKATKLIEKTEPKEAVSLKGLSEAFLGLVPIIGWVYYATTRRTNTFDTDNNLYQLMSVNLLISDYSFLVGLVMFHSDNSAISATIIPIALTFKACVNYITDKYRQYILKKEYESFKQQIEAQTRTTELPDKTKHADKRKVKQDE